MPGRALGLSHGTPVTLSVRRHHRPELCLRPRPGRGVLTDRSWLRPWQPGTLGDPLLSLLNKSPSSTQNPKHKSPHYCYKNQGKARKGLEKGIFKIHHEAPRPQDNSRDLGVRSLRQVVSTSEARLPEAVCGPRGAPPAGPPGLGVTASLPPASSQSVPPHTH